MHTIDELTDRIRSFQSSRVLLTAVELDVFSAVGRGATAARIARTVGSGERATGMLLDALVSLGALAKHGDVYHNTDMTARHLTEGSPEDARAALMHLVHLWPRWSTLTDCVRTGSRVLPPEPPDATGEHWTNAFIAAMHRNASERAPQVLLALDLAGVRRMLDLGGGSGAYSIAFARAHAGLRAEILDLPSVVPLARSYVAAAGMADRVTVHAGDIAQASYGTGYDLVWISAICHMLGPEENLAMLRKARAALARGGRVAIQDFLLDAERTGPPQAALFALNMLVGTERGNSYTGDEYAAWLGEAGFKGVRRIELPGPSDLVVGSK